MLIYEDYEKYIDEFLEPRKDFDEIYNVGKGKNRIVINYVPMGFDIETYTQYTTKNVKKSDRIIQKVDSHYTNMYIWQFGFAGYNFAGRTWDDFELLLNLIKKKICKGKYKTFMFIHNLGFEFSFLGKELTVRGHKLDVFARKKRHPLRVEIDDSIIILDSAMITGYSLKKLAENITQKTQKMSGDLDYSIPRNQYTSLTSEEELYCENDVRILVEYAEYYKDNYIDIENPYFPLTQTMVANRVLKDKIIELKARKDVTKLMMNCYPKTKNQYEYIMQFFSGAYTHGMLYNLFKKVENAKGKDVCSEYPYISLSFAGFPCSRFKPMRSVALQGDYLKSHCCLCRCTFKNIKNVYGVTILSKHKAYNFYEKECKWDNGRLWECSGEITFYLTEIDIDTLKKFYKWDSMTISEMLVAKRGYLPDYYRYAIAELYMKKSTLKGVQGKEIEYMNSKANLNSLAYGSMATKLSFEEIKYNETGWVIEENDIDFEKLQYSKDKNPAWSIYVTAGARALILSAVYEICKIDKKLYLYTDTDSCKYIADERIEKVFDKLNKKIRKENQKWIDDLNLKEMYPDVDFAELGTFADDGDYDFFKCLGSKRYLTEKDGQIHCTIAGLPKGTFEKAVKEKKVDAFEYFSDRLFFDEVESEKLTAYYEDNEKEFEVTDQQGHTEICHTYSFVSLIPTTFYLGIDEKLMKLWQHSEKLDGCFLRKKV